MYINVYSLCYRKRDQSEVEPVSWFKPHARFHRQPQNSALASPLLSSAFECDMQASSYDPDFTLPRRSCGTWPDCDCAAVPRLLRCKRHCPRLSASSSQASTKVFAAVRNTKVFAYRRFDCGEIRYVPACSSPAVDSTLGYGSLTHLSLA